MKNNYKGLKIGTIFTVLSFLLTFTFSVSMGTMLPSVFLQSKISNLFSNISIKTEGFIMIFLLAIIFIATAVITLKTVKKTALSGANLSNWKISAFMTIFYFIIHPLTFYIFWGLFMNFESDAQLIFDAVYSFPFSSLSFFIIGFLIDWYGNKFRVIV